MHGVCFVENDRKANIEVLESNKAANKDDIKRLREDNKEFRQKLAQLQRVRNHRMVSIVLAHVICSSPLQKHVDPLRAQV